MHFASVSALLQAATVLQLLLLTLAAARVEDEQPVEATALQTGAPGAAYGQLVQPAAAAVPRPSPFFGYVGELWRPDGPLPDFSYAGGYF